MHIFSIGGTDFAVDGVKSSVRMEALGDGMLEVNIDVHGDDEVFMRLTEAEDGEWSWALYPPVLFLHGLRMAEGPSGAVAVGPPGTHAAAGEAGVYMMAYRDIAAVEITALSARRLAMSGTVDFDGRQLPFHIEMAHGGQDA